MINARIFSRKGTEKDERARAIEDQERAKLERTRDEEVKIFRDSFFHKIAQVLGGKVAGGKLVDDKGKVLLAKGAELERRAARERAAQVLGRNPHRERRRPGRRSCSTTSRRWSELARSTSARRSSVSRRGDELPPGVIKMVKVYVAIKRKIQVGDKMAGRHGNKGVVSRILPEEDMPYLADGSPVDIVLNPLGVPSRMNVGQILETHLGWGARSWASSSASYMTHTSEPRRFASTPASLRRRRRLRQLVKSLEDDEVFALAKKLRHGLFMASPVFDGAAEARDQARLGLAFRSEHRPAILFDGRTGEPFDQDVTVGIMYMLKLHHLVDDKIHARSIGPYSLVTQQPLGGKAQFGGQRLGEMEVWAMEAYGAAYALQEFLTVKSDDVQGRTRMYESHRQGRVRARGRPPRELQRAHQGATVPVSERRALD